MELYPYQKKVKDLIQSGRSAILQAPTGAGKTRAALAPFIEAFFDLPANRFPKKCVILCPCECWQISLRMNTESWLRLIIESTDER